MYKAVTDKKSVRVCDIIGVFDLDSSTVSHVTRAFLTAAERRGSVESIDTLPKSFVLTEGKIYLSSRGAKRYI